MPVDTMIEIDDEEVSAFFSKLGKISENLIMKQAMVDGAIVIEAEAKNKLNTMVYQKPESPYYARTRALFNSTMADKKVNKEGGNITIGVRSNVNYSIFVHNGLGPHRVLGPRPYLTNAMTEKKDTITTLINIAVNTIAKK